MTNERFADSVLGVGMGCILLVAIMLLSGCCSHADVASQLQRDAELLSRTADMIQRRPLTYDEHAGLDALSAGLGTLKEALQ